MIKSLIAHFDVRPIEQKLLTVLEFIFDFSLVGLFLAVLNQSGDMLTEGSVQVSDNVSIVCESLIYLSIIGLLAIWNRCLRRLKYEDSSLNILRLSKFAIVAGVVYVVLGKFSLFYYGTEEFPVVLDWIVTIIKTMFLLYTVYLFSWVHSHAGQQLKRYTNRATVAILAAIFFAFVAVLFAFIDLPTAVMGAFWALSLIALCCCFVMLSRMLKFKGSEQSSQTVENA
jgi:membrane protein